MNYEIKEQTKYELNTIMYSVIYEHSLVMNTEQRWTQLTTNSLIMKADLL